MQENDGKHGGHHEIKAAKVNRNEAAEEIEDVETGFDVEGFQISIDVETKNVVTKDNNNINRKLVGRHVDYKKLGEKKTSIGAAGELLVLEMLREQYEGTDTIIEHVSKTEGDGLGYDIRVTVLLPEKHEMRIEVKTTKESYVDGFYLTPRELNAARQCLDDETSKKVTFYIYRIYNFDATKKTANIKIYEGFDEENFRLAPTCWKVHIR